MSRPYRAGNQEAVAARRARIAAVLARRSGFVPPAPTGAALRFAADYAQVYLLTYLYDVLDAPAAHGEGRETNRERARLGAALSGTDREPGSLGDLFDAPTGEPGPCAVTWAGMWAGQWLLDGLEHAYTLAGAVLAGDIDTLEVIAGVPLIDAVTDRLLTFGNVDNQVLSLASDAFRELLGDHQPTFDPEFVVDMTAPLYALPELLREARHDWTETERLALVIAGLTPIGWTTPQF